MRTHAVFHKPPGSQPVAVGAGGPAWAWAYPAFVAVHVLEVHATGLPVWISEAFAPQVSPQTMLQASLAAVALYAAFAGLIHGLGGGLLTLLPIQAVLILALGVSHCLASLLFWSYVPGTVSAALLLIPLALWTLTWAVRALCRRNFLIGVVAGLVVAVGGLART
jgi:hypothetical protein